MLPFAIERECIYRQVNVTVQPIELLMSTRKEDYTMDRRIFPSQLYKTIKNNGQFVITEIQDNAECMSLEENALDFNIKSLSIDLTSKPGMKHKRCLADNNDTTGTKMNEEFLVSIIQWAEDNGIESITFIGEDVHLLPDIKDFMRFVKQNFSGQVDIIYK